MNALDLTKSRAMLGRWERADRARVTCVGLGQRRSTAWLARLTGLHLEHTFERRFVPEARDERGMRGEAEVENADIAPFLAHVDDFLLRWIVEELWARPWGVFAVTSGEIEKLRAHFRQFLTVRDPDGEKMYFRYYDPRVLKAFLPACNRDELSKLFGPLEAYVLTEPDRDDVTFLTRQGAEAGRRASSTPPGPRRWG